MSSVDERPVSALANGTAGVELSGASGPLSVREAAAAPELAAAAAGVAVQGDGDNPLPLLQCFVRACGRLGLRPHNAIARALWEGDRILGQYPVHIEVPGSMLTNAEASTLAEVIREFPHVVWGHLDLRNNQIGASGGELLVGALRSSGAAVGDLNLSGNSLGRDCIQDILSSGIACAALNLSHCQVSRLTPLGSFGRLHTLILDNNPSLCSLPERAFVGAPFLRRISLCGSGIFNLWTTVAALRQLELLEEVRLQRIPEAELEVEAAAEASSCRVAEGDTSWMCYEGSESDGGEEDEEDEEEASEDDAFALGEDADMDGAGSGGDASELYSRIHVTAAPHLASNQIGTAANRDAGEDGSSGPMVVGMDIDGDARVEQAFRCRSAIAPEGEASAGAGDDGEAAAKCGDSGCACAEVAGAERLRLQGHPRGGGPEREAVHSCCAECGPPGAVGDEVEVGGFEASQGGRAGARQGRHLSGDGVESGGVAFGARAGRGGRTRATGDDARVMAVGPDEDGENEVGLLGSGPPAADLLVETEGEGGAAGEEDDEEEREEDDDDEQDMPTAMQDETDVEGNGGSDEEDDSEAQLLASATSPICRQRMYREFMVVHLPSLKMLDDKAISVAERQAAAGVVDKSFEPLAHGRRRLVHQVRAIANREIGVRLADTTSPSKRRSPSAAAAAAEPTLDRLRHSPVGFARSMCAAAVRSTVWPRRRIIAEAQAKPRQFEYHPRIPGMLVLGTMNGELVVMDHNLDREYGSVVTAGAPHSILGLCWLRQHPSRLIAGTDNGVIQLFGINNMRRQPQAANGTRSVRTGGLAEAAAAASGSLPGAAIHTFQEFEQLTSVHVNSTDEMFLASGYSKHVALYHVELGKRLQVLENLHNEHINVVKFAHHSPSVFATSSFDRDIKMWDLRQAITHPVFTASSSTGNVMVCFSHDDKYLLSSAVDNEVRQHLASDGRLHLLFDLPGLGSRDNYTRSYYMNASDYIVTGSCEENVVRVCETKAGRRLRDITLEGPSSSIEGTSVYVQSLRSDPFSDFSCAALVAYNNAAARSHIVKLDMLAKPFDDDDDDRRRTVVATPAAALAG